MVALQDADPDSRTYGIWSWFLEEPLDKMSPPDWNWADFIGVQLLAVLLDHSDRIPAALREQVAAAVVHAARAIIRRDVGPSYTNIAVMGAYVTLVAGEHLDLPDIADYGRRRLERFADHTRRLGGFTEYNSPTYTVVALSELARIGKDVRNDKMHALAVELEEIGWRGVARHFHPPTRQWAGSHSRCYSSLLPASTLSFLQLALDGRGRWMSDEKLTPTTDSHRTPA